MRRARPMHALAMASALAGCAPAKPAATVAPPAAAVPPTPPPPAPFEGVITRTVTAGDKGTSVFSVSGSKQRIDFTPGGLSIIRDTTTSEVTILSHAAHRATIEDAREETDPTPVVEAHKTGVDTVAGRACDVWRITEADDVVDACVTTSIPSIRIGAHAAWEARAPGFPLRVRTVNVASGIVRLEAVVVEIVEKAVPEGTFEVPAGYAVVRGGR